MIDCFKLEMSLGLRVYILGRNIWNKLEKPVNWEEEFDIYFCVFLAAIAKVLFLDEKIDARIYMHTNLTVFLYFLVS